MFGIDYVFDDNMFNNKDKIIFHIDVNSAYLSWTAVKLL
jgi:DNA polymerase-4